MPADEPIGTAIPNAPRLLLKWPPEPMVGVGACEPPLCAIAFSDETTKALSDANVGDGPSMAEPGSSPEKSSSSSPDRLLKLPSFPSLS